jgi:flagellar hook-length control protein FliK
MSQRDGQLVIRMYAEDPAVRQAIERMLPNLRSDLRQGDGQAQVITVESSSGDRNGDRNGDRDGQRHGERGPDDRGAWQGQQQQQRHERAYNGGHSGRGSERLPFSLEGAPAVEPVAVVPRPRSLGSRSPAGSVDALA